MIIILVMAAMFAIGVPIAYTLGLTGMLALIMAGTVKLQIVPLMMFNGAESYVLVAIPLFILMGQIMNNSSISSRLIEFACSIVGFIRGGLGMAAVMTGAIMAAISGSAIADAAALGSILIPQMEKRKYGKSLAVSTVSCAASLASIIPPSINMILYAVIAKVSITALFIAGIIPGLCLALGLMLVIYFFALRMKLPVEGRFEVQAVKTALKRAWLGLLLPIIVIGGILGGFFTPTEAGTVGIVYSLFLSVIVYKELTFKGFVQSLVRAAKQTSVVVIMISTSALLGWYITQQQIPQQLAQLILGISDNPYIVLFLVTVLLLIAGMFLQATPLIVMIIPMVVPLMSSVGVDLIQFGLIAVVAICVGQLSPPVAAVLMVTCGIAHTSMEKILNTLLPMMGVFILIIIIAAVVPGFTLWLPSVVVH